MVSWQILSAKHKHTSAPGADLCSEGNVGLIFTKGDLKEVREVAKYKVGAPARVGLVAPFNVVENGLVVLTVYENGSVFSPEMLDLTENNLIEKFALGVSMVTSLALAIHYPTIAAAPLMLINGYKNLLAVAVDTEENLMMTWA